MSANVRYTYQLAACDPDQLKAEVAALNLQGWVPGVQVGAGVVALDFAAPISAEAEASVAAAVAAHVPNPNNGITRLRAAASDYFGARLDRVQLVDRAIVLAARLSDNVVREWLTNLKAAVAASSSLANYQARVAQLPDLPPLSVALVKQTVLDLIAAGDAD